MSDKEYEAWLRKQAARDEDETAPDDDARSVQAPVADGIRQPAREIFGGGGAIEMDPDADAAPVTERHAHVPDEAAMQKHAEAKRKQQDAVWYAVVGVAMMFMSGFHWGIGVGGMFMVVYGTVRYLHFGRIAKHAFDPWDDPDIDAWEREEMG